MSVRRLAAEQPEGFAFTPENLEWAKAQIKQYPEGRQASAVLSLLWRAQEQMGGWIPEPALRYVADMLNMAYIRVYEIVTFYTMFNLAPVGRHYVQVCGTTPCMLRGAEDIKDVCRKAIGPKDTVSEDGLFSWTEVECLGACVNAPMAQINKYYYEDLTPENFESILKRLRAGEDVEPGPQNGRQTSAPLGGPNTLTDPALYTNDSSGAEPGSAGAVLIDASAKRPGAAANVREAGVPKPPLDKSRKPKAR
ncbi:NADH-quinone oxidoreductase [Methyloceanibacter superfactus]|jgi:NADH-quinone oxidoreductase subunit E|uniref:NADH-quinone oxidoreductase n=1 Tax=Methyloceanibacter superfactus TaxID=1774969 RepID=A0A1E3VPJ7_9HYPH|nr:NADH-quinone oxidoreductase subunit NuoE [Methyloceanibacter superfactus]ODR95412.1 NADH-quinone oxidoreductase [Methyloceanibacter superfactus]